MDKRAVIYARYSSHNQREESIEDQVRICQQKAEDDGYEVIRVYADKAISGTTDKRPDFLRMISHAERHDFTRVYIYKTDRFARSRYDSAIYKSKLRKNGVEVVCACESIPEGPDGIILESVLEGMAEWYSANLSQNVKRGLDGNARKGKANGVTKFGLTINKEGYYEINEPEAQMLRDAAKAWIGGQTLRQIADTICLPFKSLHGKRITPGRLSFAFRDEKYRGVNVWNGIRVEGAIPRVFDEELCKQLDEKIANDGRSRRKKNGAYMLSGILFDRNGNPFWGNSGRNHDGKKYNYYRCYETGETYPQEEVEGKVVLAVSELLSDENLADKVADLVIQAQEDAMCEEVDQEIALEKRLDSIVREINKLIDLVAKTEVTDEIVSKLNALQEDKVEISAELDEVKRRAPILTKDHVLFWLKQAREKKDPRELIPGFVSRVLIDSYLVVVEVNIPGVSPVQVPGSELFSLAEEEGFEPSLPRLWVKRFSRPPHSTTLPPLRIGMIGRYVLPRMNDVHRA